MFFLLSSWMSGCLSILLKMEEYCLRIGKIYASICYYKKRPSCIFYYLCIAIWQLIDYRVLPNFERTVIWGNECLIWLLYVVILHSLNSNIYENYSLHFCYTFYIHTLFSSLNFPFTFLLYFLWLLWFLFRKIQAMQKVLFMLTIFFFLVEKLAIKFRSPQNNCLFLTTSLSSLVTLSRNHAISPFQTINSRLRIFWNV